MKKLFLRAEVLRDLIEEYELKLRHKEAFSTEENLLIEFKVKNYNKDFAQTIKALSMVLNEEAIFHFDKSYIEFESDNIDFKFETETEQEPTTGDPDSPLVWVERISRVTILDCVMDGEFEQKCIDAWEYEQVNK